MIRFILLSLLPLGSCIAVIAQELPFRSCLNLADSLGRKQGWWCKATPDGVKVYEGAFVNDLPVDTFTYFYPNGTTKASVIHTDNARVAVSTTWFPNGKKMSVGRYIDRERDSLWQFFNEFDGSLISEEFYRKGKKEGQEKIFYPGGGVAETLSWKAGIEEGTWLQYFEDGTVKLKCQFMNGEKEGRLEAFFPSGKLQVTGSYANGHQDGEWIYYDEEGAVVDKMHYDKGTLLKPD